MKSMTAKKLCHTWPQICMLTENCTLMHELMACYFCFVAHLFHQFTETTQIIGELILTWNVELTIIHAYIKIMMNVTYIATVNFNLLSDVSFSLTCISTGGPVDSIIWTRDGLLLDNTGPLVLTNVSTVSYTNVLLVNNRALGIYTCQTRGSGGQLLNSTLFTVSGIYYI